jgi:uroporphyrinogen-III synthase
MTRQAASPLAGLRVAVTRPARQDDPLASALQLRGAIPVVLPLVVVAAAADTAPLQTAVARLAECGWVVFTSANAVRFFGDAWLRAGGDTPPQLRVAAVGPATAEAVAEVLGWRVDAMPAAYTGAALTAAMQQVAPVAGVRVLWPRAAEARDALPRDLQAAGAILDAPVAYSTRAEAAAARQLAELVQQGGIDIITLTSPSAATSLAAAGQAAGLHWPAAAAPEATGAAAQPGATGAAAQPGKPAGGRCVVAAIGPSTAETAAAAGLVVHVMPEEHTIPGLVAALEAYMGRQS